MSRQWAQSQMRQGPVAYTAGMTDLLPDTLRALARYNRLANERLYDGAAELSDAARKADRGAFFGSIHNTLNHILVGDRIWMSRFEGTPAPATRLDTILYDDFSALRAARRAEDQRIEAFFATLSPAALAGSLRWTSMAGESFNNSMALIAIHLFNHQTHHRGQAHDLLCQAGIRHVVLDIPRIVTSFP